MMSETMLVSVTMYMSELSHIGGATFKYDGNDVAPVTIPREAWQKYGRPTEVKVRIVAITPVTA